ncbi:MAG: dihydrodipicolinate synthase family protein [Bilophila wadsworthia]
MTRLADAAYSEGYEAVMALPHYYFAQTPRQLEAYFDTLGGRFEGEWLIYNFPARTGCDVDAALIAKLAARFPRFMGVKDTWTAPRIRGPSCGPRPRCARIFRCCAGSTSISSPT